MARSDSEGLSLGYRIGFTGSVTSACTSSARPSWATARTRTPGCDVSGSERSRRPARRGESASRGVVRPGSRPVQDRACADARSFAFCRASTSSALVIRRATLDLEPGGQLVEVLLARVRVDPARRWECRSPGVPRRPRVGRPVLVLRLPVVADLLVGVLQRARTRSGTSAVRRRTGPSPSRTSRRRSAAPCAPNVAGCSAARSFFALPVFVVFGIQPAWHGRPPPAIRQARDACPLIPGAAACVRDASAEMTYDCVVVGAGAAGVTASRALAEAGVEHARARARDSRQHVGHPAVGRVPAQHSRVDERRCSARSVPTSTRRGTRPWSCSRAAPSGLPVRTGTAVTAVRRVGDLLRVTTRDERAGGADPRRRERAQERPAACRPPRWPGPPPHVARPPTTTGTRPHCPKAA